MTKISKKAAYPVKNPVRQDYFVGTDSENNGKTVNFDFEKTAKLINELNGTSIVNYLFKTDNNIPLEVLTEGVFLSEGNETTFADITKLYINKKNFHETDMAQLFQFIALNKEVFELKIRNSSNLNNAVYFNITDAEEFETHFILDVAIDINNAAIPELIHFNVYFFDFELKSSGTGGGSDPLKLDKGGYTGTAQDLSNSINSIAFPDQVLKAGEIVITGLNAFVSAADFQWRLNQVDYLTAPAFSEDIDPATDGFNRTDILEGDNAGIIHLKKGTENIEAAPEPEVTIGRIRLAAIPIFGSTIGVPSLPIVGDNFVLKIEKDGWPDYDTTGNNAFIPAPSTGQALLIVYNTGLNSLDGVDFSAVVEAYNGQEFKILNRTGGPVTLNPNATVSAGQAKFRLFNDQSLIIPNTGQVAFYNFNKIALTQTWKSWDEVTAEDLDNIYTKSETDDLLDLKLDSSAYNQHFKGVYVTLAALNSAHPTAAVGDYAQVNEVGATDVVNYNWDDEDGIWVAGGGTGGAANTDALPEGSANLYFTTARVLSTLLTGISFVTGGAIVSTDSVLAAFGKIQKQIDDLLATGSRLITSGEITKLSNTSNTNSGDETATTIAAINHAAAAKTVLIDADEVTGQNSASSFSLIRTVWSDVWTYIRGKAMADTSFMVKDVTETGTSFSLSDAYNGKVVILTASCTVTIPNGLIAGFEVSIVTLAGVTLTVALGGSVVLFNNVGTTMAEKLSCTIKNRTATNNYITAGSL